MPQSRIDDAARRILVVKCEMGLLEATGTGRPDADRRGRLGRAPGGGATGGGGVGGGPQERRRRVAAVEDRRRVALGGKTADNIGNQCGGWTVTWQGTSGNVTPGATTVRQAFESVLGTSHVNYALTGSTTAGATVGMAVIGETPYSEGKGDRTDLTRGRAPT